jgi:hypothetical protein
VAEEEKQADRCWRGSRGRGCSEPAVLCILLCRRFRVCIEVCVLTGLHGEPDRVFGEGSAHSFGEVRCKAVGRGVGLFHKLQLALAEQLNERAVEQGLSVLRATTPAQHTTDGRDQQLMAGWWKGRERVRVFAVTPENVLSRFLDSSSELFGPALRHKFERISVQPRTNRETEATQTRCAHYK